MTACEEAQSDANAFRLDDYKLSEAALAISVRNGPKRKIGVFRFDNAEADRWFDRSEGAAMCDGGFLLPNESLIVLAELKSGSDSHAGEQLHTTYSMLRERLRALGCLDAIQVRCIAVSKSGRPPNLKRWQRRFKADFNGAVDLEWKNVGAKRGKGRKRRSVQLDDLLK